MGKVRLRLVSIRPDQNWVQCGQRRLQKINNGKLRYPEEDYHILPEPSQSPMDISPRTDEGSQSITVIDEGDKTCHWYAYYIFDTAASQRMNVQKVLSRGKGIAANPRPRT